MNYYEDALKEFNNVYTKDGVKKLKSNYKESLQKIFFVIYAINYLKNRIETKNNFSNEYFEISFSCLLESYSLIMNNYPRGSALVLRSSLENFLKSIIYIHNKKCNKKYHINDRSYTENKKTLETIIQSDYFEYLKKKSTTLNSQMESEYKSLSGLSHSLVPESKNNIIKYFSEIDKFNEDNITIVLKKILNVAKYIFGFCAIISQPSLKNWESDDLKKLLRLVYRGKNTAERFFEILKEI